jgi:hypothetical protein
LLGLRDVRNGSKADLTAPKYDFRYSPENGHRLPERPRPLSAKGRHWRRDMRASKPGQFKPSAPIRSEAKTTDRDDRVTNSTSRFIIFEPLSKFLGWSLDVAAEHRTKNER